MKKPVNFQMLFIVLVCLSCMLTGGLAIQESKQSNNPGKLFVFGDSYADTGNWNKIISIPWKVPYGITFPGTPAGRYSDGRVLTDFIASFLNIQTPVAFAQIRSPGSSLQFGVNFAYGGTGVFQTLVPGPTLSVQINSFRQLLNQNVYTRADLASSVALVSVAGNDYVAYPTLHRSMPLPVFTKTLVVQLSKDLQSLQQLGFRKILITTLPPAGCLPLETITSLYRTCKEVTNVGSRFHNQLLSQAVETLNKASATQQFQILDIYSAFISVLRGQSPAGLKPCCEGLTPANFCGETNIRTGVKLYTVCNNPEQAFFWDIFHPTQAGWQAVYSVLKPSLQQLL